MKHNEGTFIGDGNLELFYQSWHPEEEPKAVMALVHGLGEHGGRYPHLVDHLVSKGYAIYALDHRGHGRSPNFGSAHVNNFSEFRGDVMAFIDMVKAKEPNRPFFLMGHSMGGCIALNTVLHQAPELTGLIASAPAVGQLDIPPVLLFISKLLSRFWPSLGVATGLDASAISRDPAMVKAYEGDPLVHGKATPRFSTELINAAAWSTTNAAKLNVPLLMIHGDADALVNVANSREFFAQVTHPDKKLIIYEGGYHEGHNDIHHQQAATDIENWLDAHL